MDKDSLLGFIARAHRHTYAAPKEVKDRYKCSEPILPGHKDYDYVEDDWRYHDSYTGSAWAPGREVVFFKDKPVWCMAYQGQTIDGLTEEFTEELFGFLKKALRAFKDDMPFRGLDGFKDGDFRYFFGLDGDHTYFKGREAVTYKGKEVFFQDVMGEVVKFYE